MINYSTIGKAVDHVLSWQEAKYGSCITWNQAYAGVMNWYENTDITDPKELAACVLHYGTQYHPVKYNEIKAATDKYFSINERW